MPYTTITTEGGLLPADILDAIAAGELEGQRPEDFGLERTRKLSDRISAAWQAVRGQWLLFQSYLADLPAGETATTETREQWVLPLLRILGYQLARNRSAYIVHSRTFAISHRMGEGDDAPPVHIESIRNSLDARPPSGRPRLSPHALMQEYLNSTEQLWGMVTNGERLRLLRDSVRFTRPSYVEFDLRAMIEGEQFSEFALLYRLLHRSRLPVHADEAAACLLEKYHQRAIESGGRVREGLRDGVEFALKRLGDGLLRHPANAGLRARLGLVAVDGTQIPHDGTQIPHDGTQIPQIGRIDADRTNENSDPRSSAPSAPSAFYSDPAPSAFPQLTPEEFYRQLLRLVYRLLFLMVAEERGLIASEGAHHQGTKDTKAEPDLSDLGALRALVVPPPNTALRIYYDYYSVGRLRRLAETSGAGRGPYSDLWDGLLTTFRILEGSDEIAPRRLGLAPLDGDLFGESACAALTTDTRIANADLLAAVRALSLYRDKESQQLRRVNYGALDVEELGSVYESLLDYRPVVTVDSTRMAQIGRIGADQTNENSDPRSSAPSAPSACYRFDLVSGTERKTTGSYYTRPELVQELIKSALVPVLEERLRLVEKTRMPHDGTRMPQIGRIGADRTTKNSDPRPSAPSAPSACYQTAEEAILSIRVCDPACGSGAFLLAAARRLGRELARVRAGEDQPSPTQFRHAVRDVIRNCIFGVDLNPLAVDLCKLSLWIEGHAAGLPLSFLDHHIRHGNSLVGATRELVEAGIPDQAYKPVSGDEKATASSLKKRNKQERELHQQQGMLQHDLFGAATALGADLAAALRALDAAADDSVAAVRARAARYAALRRQAHAERARFDLWTAAFFQPLTSANARYVPTTKDLLDFDPGSEQALMAAPLAEEVGFFHWELEFPQVFADSTRMTQDRDRTRIPQIGRINADRTTENIENTENSDPRSSAFYSGSDPRSSASSAPSAFYSGSGFDVILGNPPWERIKLQEQEHFVDVPEIRAAANKAARAKAIAAWRQGDERQRARIAQFDAAKQRAEAESRFVRASGRFPLTAVGDVNTYALFAEHSRNLLAPTGRAGIIVPTGIATDDTTKAFFAAIVTSQSLVSFISFENEARIFAEVHHAFKFAAVTMSGSGTQIDQARFVFFCRHFEHVTDPVRNFTLSTEDFLLINPNTRTAPVFRTAQDAELTKKIYRHAPVLINERADVRAQHAAPNPWGVRFTAMFHMSNDSHLFATAPGDGLLPLYEGKMIWHFDHRYGTYAGATQAQLNLGSLPQPGADWKQDPANAITPRYWVPTNAITERLAGRWERGWLLGFRDVTSNVVERTAIFSLLPRVGVGHTLPLIFFASASATQIACFLVSINSLVFDFITRQKLGGTHLTYTYLNQLPVLPPSSFTPADILYIVPRVVELVYTAWDIKAFAEDVWAEADDELRALIYARWEAQNSTHMPDNGTRIAQIERIDTDPNQNNAGPIRVHPHNPRNPRSILPPPFIWNDARRAQIRAELDARIAKLYGLTRDELRYILDPADVYGPEFPGETFRVLKEKETKLYGEYRTRRLVLEAWDGEHRKG
ncbi:Eco57I restriction-modification methylase domain-containing protein [Candidatus Viridilinea mediisalina]|uniref:Eco57I restriction-modification methylase domain-containing protein n=1 Tax=Candidatus Viridilinea mediisalina TaxID=2024553 RepID=UPI00157F81DF|nr:DNA methyltransferase [Candidatus Viridilinea mediisalina]